MQPVNTELSFGAFQNRLRDFGRLSQTDGLDFESFARFFGKIMRGLSFEKMDMIEVLSKKYGGSQKLR
jgi:hypothetical protein